MKKKGSLSLSIEAIIIIVIAFVVLGLALTFVRGQMTKMTESAGEVQEQIRQQILEDLRTGDKKLSFPTEEVKLAKGESKQLSIGVKNMEETPLSFRLEIKLIETGENAEDKEEIKDKDDYVIGKFIWDTSDQNLGPTESNVYPIKFIAGKHADTYTFQVIIKAVGGGEAGAATGIAAGEVYATKSFFITIL